MVKVFVSSVIRGYERYRRAAREAIGNRGAVMGVLLQPVMAESDYPALSSSPQMACFQGVMESDIYLLILGNKYGWINPQTHLSATHEEYRAAKSANKPILVFVQSVKKQLEQQGFEQEVSGYTTGHFRASFRNPDGLRLEIEHALEEYLLSFPPALMVPKSQAGAAQYTQTISGNPTVVVQHLNTLTIPDTQKKTR